MNALAPDVSLVGETADPISNMSTLSIVLQGIMILTSVRSLSRTSRFTF